MKDLELPSPLFSSGVPFGMGHWMMWKGSSLYFGTPPVDLGTEGEVAEEDLFMFFPHWVGENLALDRI